MERIAGYWKMLAGRIPVKELLTVLFLATGVWLLRRQSAELLQLPPLLAKAGLGWVLAGVLLSLAGVGLQVLTLRYSLRSVAVQLPLAATVSFYLKRNFLGTLLPAGNITSLAYLPALLRRHALNRVQLFQGIGVNGFICIASLVLFALPVLVGSAWVHQQTHGAGAALAAAVLVLVLLVAAVGSLRKGSRVQQLLTRRFPKQAGTLTAFAALDLNRRQAGLSLLFSLLVEFAGVLQLYAACRAAGVQLPWTAVGLGYVVATLFLVISPLFKGLGVVEVSLVLLLQGFGCPLLQALEITLLFRFFEFWLPLLAGTVSWLWGLRHLVLRLLAPLLLLVLGAVNILSVLTPPLRQRIHLLKAFLPASSLYAFNWLTLLSGVVLIILTFFLFKGLRRAWLLALSLSVLSVVFHLVKGLDWEEASLAMVVAAVLLLTRRQYLLRSDPNRLQLGLVAGLSVMATALVCGTVGFHWLDVRHFGQEFSWTTSAMHALNSLMLTGLDHLQPVTFFGREFVVFVQVLSALAWLVLLLSALSPLAYGQGTNETNRMEAQRLVLQYGASAMDVFKLAPEQRLFFASHLQGFMAYRIAAGFAIALEAPVCAPENKRAMIVAFTDYCRQQGLQPACYRATESDLEDWKVMGKKHLLIGQEGLVDLEAFSLNGKEMKSLRNGLNSLQKKGYATRLHTAPLSESLVAGLEAVSDEWLRTYNRSEAVFSQGMFDAAAIAQQTVICLHDAEDRVVAFLNIVPDYAPRECTYDLIRKTATAPGAAMDALIIAFIEEGRRQGCVTLNMGLAPMSGIENAESTAEKVVKYAYQRMRRFQHYQGLRAFKEKYVTRWEPRYLVFGTDYDLIQLPGAIRTVMQPPAPKATTEPQPAVPVTLAPPTF